MDVRSLSCLLVLVFGVQAYYDPYSDSTRFVVTFPGPLPKVETDAKPSASLDITEEDDSLVLVTESNEKYKCIIPEVSTTKSPQKQAKDELNYAGASERELLTPLLQQSSCSYKIEPYWTYELCHNRFIRQYHEERETDKDVKLQEYYLGYYKEKEEESIDKSEEKNQKKVRTKQIGGLDLPYYEINYTDGTICDLTGKPRRTSVLYICHELGRGEIYELKETSSCEYEIVILTELLCLHPMYTKHKDPINKISCHALNGSPRKPNTLINFELENAQTHYNKPQRAVWSLKQEKGEAYIKINVDEDLGEGHHWDEIDWEDEFGLSLEAVKKFILKTIQKQEQLYPKTEIQKPPKSHTPVKYIPPDSPSKPGSETTDLQSTETTHLDAKAGNRMLLTEFLSGDFCVEGGTGWWHHDFCYQKRVTQFHKDDNGKTTIVLGVWDKQAHLDWLEKHPSKKPKHVNKEKEIIYQYYGNGDICDVTGHHRYVEVRLKCKDHPNRVQYISEYLMEIKTCEYILVVESPMFCIAQDADLDGFIDIPTHQP